MAQKLVTLSDLSGTEVPEGKHARIVVEEHPSISSPVELDVTVEEAAQFQTTKLELVHLKVYEPDQPPRSVVLEAKTLANLFKGIKMDDVIGNARKVELAAPAARAGRPRGSAGRVTPSRADRIDYTDTQNFGLIHRGKVTEEEAALVRSNMGQANANRAREGQPRVGDDPKDSKRYNLD